MAGPGNDPLNWPDTAVGQLQAICIGKFRGTQAIPRDGADHRAGVDRRKSEQKKAPSANCVKLHAILVAPFLRVRFSRSFQFERSRLVRLAAASRFFRTPVPHVFSFPVKTTKFRHETSRREPPSLPADRAISKSPVKRQSASERLCNPFLHPPFLVTLPLFECQLQLRSKRDEEIREKNSLLR